MYFSRSSMVDYLSVHGPLKDGQQTSVNHNDCPAGVDTKSRLYIKRDRSKYLFYCHHCGNRGVYAKSTSIARASEINADVCGVSIGIANDLVVSLESSGHGLYDVDKWSREARDWWFKYGFNRSDAIGFKAQYNESDGRLWLRAGNNLWQGRGFGTKCKYYTIGNIAANTIQTLHYDCTTLILVEDILSAYRIRKCGGAAMALLGTKFQAHHFQYIEPYKRIMIMLDHDPAGKNGAVEIYKTLSSTNKEVDTVFEYDQPKEMSETKLKHYCTQ